MSTASEILSDIAPQFATATGRSGALEQAEGATSSTFYGSQRNRAVALLAAHWLSLETSSARRDGSGGPISSKSEGSLSVSFGSVGATKSALGQTHFGMELLELRASYPSVGITGIPFMLAGAPGR